MTGFVGWCIKSQMDWKDADELDSVMIVYFDQLFWHGVAAAEGSKILAALKFFVPGCSRLAVAHVPRCHRAVQSWSRLRPGYQRLPVPWLVVCAMIGYLCSINVITVALMLLVQFRTYMRPGALDRLKVKQLIGPTGMAGPRYSFWAFNLSPAEDLIPGKTGTYDDAILYDAEIPWITEFFMKLTSGRHPESPLWSTMTSRALDLFSQCTTALNLEALNLCRYSLRHGGASEDIVTSRRTLLEVKRRGAWRTDQSLGRYAKEARVLGELKKVSPRVLSLGKMVSENLGPVLLQKMSVCVPVLNPHNPPPAKRLRKAIA